MQLISEDKPSAIQEIFGRKKVIIGVIHCQAFPGSPNARDASVESIYSAALADAEAYLQGGVHGLIVENHGDIPFLKPDLIGPETAAFMGVITDRIRQKFGVPIGINVLANAAIPALAVAQAGGAAFIRVNQWANAYIANEGIVEGAAATALRYRAALRADNVRIFADAHVKHGSHAIVADRSVAELTRDVDFFHADCVIATGQRTGDTADFAEIDTIRSATRLPLLIGSGATAQNISGLLERTDGVIVASSLKAGGVWWNPVERARVEAFMAAAKTQLGPDPE
jgi:membrane complex biogenesis BtpA family protein